MCFSFDATHRDIYQSSFFAGGGGGVLFLLPKLICYLWFLPPEYCVGNRSLFYYGNPSWTDISIMFRTMESHSLSYQDKTFICSAGSILCYLTIKVYSTAPRNLVKEKKTDAAVKIIACQIKSIFKHGF